MFSSISFPDRERIVAYGRFLAIFCLLFFPVYIAGGWVASRTDHPLALYLDSELAIRFVPAMVWAYLSLYPLFLLPLFHLNVVQLSGLSRQSVLVILVAGIAFITIPAKLGFPPLPPGDENGILISLIRTIDTPYNLVPSLHVAFTWLILLACAKDSSSALKGIYALWIVLVSASTILIHQHHLLDVATGALLAAGVRKFMPLSPYLGAR